MAVTKAQPNLHVHVMVDGVPVHELEDDEEKDTPNIVHKIREDKSVALSCSLYVVMVDGEVINISNKNEVNITLQKLCEKLCFSKLKIDASGAPTITNALIESLSNVGNIKADVFRVRIVRKSKSTKDIDVAYSPIPSKEVPEKALKGLTLSHLSSFQPATKARAQRYAPFEYIDGRKNPIATFIFKYRSRAALQSLLIIPRTPSPIPLEEREVDSLTLEESRQLISRFRARVGSTAQVKGEGAKRELFQERGIVAEEDGGGDDLLVVSTKRRRLSFSVNKDGVETIDLT